MSTYPFFKNRAHGYHWSLNITHSNPYLTLNGRLPCVRGNDVLLSRSIPFAIQVNQRQVITNNSMQPPLHTGPVFNPPLHNSNCADFLFRIASGIVAYFFRTALNESVNRVVSHYPFGIGYLVLCEQPTARYCRKKRVLPARHLNVCVIS